jgi:rSAM/selenodomain-associated transferase 2
MGRVSIVIPVRDEPAEVGHAIASWWKATPAESELCVVDAADSPASRVLREKGARVISAPGATRGARLARAAELASGDTLVFLHADSRPPHRAVELLREAIERGAAAGAFSLAYADADRVMRWTAFWANVRSRYLRLPFGDQGLFCTRAAYDRAGGFRDLPICEDVDLVRRLKRTGPFVVLPERVVTSPRRYRRRGAARQTFRVWTTLAGYYLGVDPARLARWYARN